MLKIDDYELEVLSAYEKGMLESVATESELAKLKEAARATAIKDRRVNIAIAAKTAEAHPPPKGASDIGMG